MYIGAGLALAGAAILYGSLSLLGYVVLFLLATHAFVVFYEEPTLMRLFLLNPLAAARGSPAPYAPGRYTPSWRLTMPKYVIEREIPGAGKLSPKELKAISQTSAE